MFFLLLLLLNVVFSWDVQQKTVPLNSAKVFLPQTVNIQGSDWKLKVKYDFNAKLKTTDKMKCSLNSLKHHIISYDLLPSE